MLQVYSLVEDFFELVFGIPLDLSPIAINESWGIS